jgi:hypothetical protein
MPLKLAGQLVVPNIIEIYPWVSKMNIRENKRTEEADNVLNLCLSDVLRARVPRHLYHCQFTHAAKWQNLFLC